MVRVGKLLYLNLPDPLFRTPAGTDLDAKMKENRELVKKPEEPLWGSEVEDWVR